jgi:hypothetical protein
MYPELKVYPYPPGIHATWSQLTEPDNSIVYGLETLIVSITPEGLRDINRVFGSDFIKKNIAVRVFETNLRVPEIEVVEYTAKLNELARMHKTKVLYDLAEELAKSIEPRPFRSNNEN